MADGRDDWQINDADMALCCLTITHIALCFCAAEVLVKERSSKGT
jgi:hypothetical protein